VNKEEIIMRYYHTIIIIIMGLMLCCEASAPKAFGVGEASEQNTGRVLPQEAEQVLFIIDDSASMTEIAFAPNAPKATRWEVLQRVFPEWLDGLGPDTLVGALSVGGECGDPPAIKLPVGTDRKLIAAEVAKARPHGDTSLNAALEETPKFFAPWVRGSKRIVLLSDGLNNCPPNKSTCEIAKELHKNHGIIIDVVAWITKPSMVDEFECVAKFTGGTFKTPRTIKDWKGFFKKFPLQKFDPWPYVVLALGFATLFLAARVLYRHGSHVLGWGTARSTLAGAVLLLIGTLLLYLVLFVKAGLVAALLGSVVLVTMLVLASRRRTQRLEPTSNSDSPWSTIGVVFLTTLMVLQPSASYSDLPTKLTARVQGPPHYHHILALDLSGSVTEYIEDMKFLLARYAEMYTLPDEEISLVGFAFDESGSVKKLYTFTVPESGSTVILNHILDDLSIRHPSQTRTYFKPLADFLNEFLKEVRLQPIIMVVSDGKSDGFQDANRGIVDFREIPFESFAQRGVYAAPGMQNWKVAIAGGSGLDLTALFQKPITSQHKGGHSPQLLGPVIEPELIDPILLVETDETLKLRPTWNPFSRRVYGTLSIRVRNDRVTRFRTFRIELRKGNDTLPLGGKENALIDENPQTFDFPFAWETMKQEAIDAVVQVILEQGGGTTRTIYPKPTTIKIKEVSYWAAFWHLVLLISLATPTLVSIGALVLRSHVKREHNRPEIIKVLGGPSIPLARFQQIMIGGEGCQLVVPGVPAGTVLTTAERTGTRGVLIIRTLNGTKMKVNGADVTGSVAYHLGQPLQFITADGNSYDVTLYSSTSKDITPFGTPITGGNWSGQ